MSDRLKISHYYTTGTTKPTAAELENGEIAVSMNTGNEKLYIKNNGGTVVDFLSYSSILKKNNTFTGINTFSNSIYANGMTYYNNVMVFNRSCTGATIGNSAKSFTFSGGDIIVCGTTTSTGGFFDTSDERLKNFSENINVDFEQLKKLRKSYFSFKDDIDNKQHIGVSAQEIKNVFPEIVNEDKNGILTVDYSKLSVVALAAIDELNEKYEKLEKRLQMIEEKLGC